MITKLLVLILTCIIGLTLSFKAEFTGMYRALWMAFCFLAGSGAVYWGGVIERWRWRSPKGGGR